MSATRAVRVVLSRSVIAALFAAGVLSQVADLAWSDQLPPCRQQHDICEPCPYCPPPAADKGPSTPAPAAEAAPPSAEPSLPAMPPTPSLAFSEQTGAFGGNLLSVPNVIGENFGGGRGRSVIADIVPYSIRVRGVVLNGTPGAANSTLAFEAGPGETTNDFYSQGLGRDTNGDEFVDTFDITEPVPPSNAPTSPGPDYTFDGGTASEPGNTPYRVVDNWTANYSYSALLNGENGIVIPDPGGGLVVGRLKIAENCSPIPRDRLFFNYSLFDNVPLTSRGVTVNRFTAGFEKTFANELMSLEMRCPMAATLDSDIVVGGPTELSNPEFGDIFLAYKALLTYGPRGAISAGLSLTVPTADDVNVYRFDGRPLVRIENDSVHLMPFLGWLWVPNRFFTQGFLQVDVDANGNPVDVNLGRGLTQAGRYQDETFLYADLSSGYWLWQADPHSRRCLTGFAPIAEVHYNRSLQSSDVVTEGPFRIGEYHDEIQMLHLLLGGHVQMGWQTTLTSGYTVPIGNGADQLFDGELRVLLNRYF